MDKLKVAIISIPALTIIKYPVFLSNSTIKEMETIIITSNASYYG